MNKKHAAVLDYSLFLLDAGAANASMMVIPMNTGSWSYKQDGTSGAWENTSDGVQFYGSGYRQGGAIISSVAEDFSDATLYFKWMVNGGSSGNYLGAGPGLVTDAGYLIIGAGTTNHSFNGSSLLPQNTWLYTRISTHANMTWDYITATGNYDNQSGATLYSRSESTSNSQQWIDYV